MEYSTIYMGFTAGGRGDLFLVQRWYFGIAQKRVVFVPRRGRAIRPNWDKRLEVPLDGVTLVGKTLVVTKPEDRMPGHSGTLSKVGAAD